MEGFDYNTQLSPVILKEYGRNVQKLSNYIITIEDRDKRNKYAQLLVELMRQIHPNMREGQDYTNKLWDDLYIVSGFNLDVDSPFPLPEKTLLGKKPKKVGYNMHELRFKHYGHNVDLMIKKAVLLEDPEEQMAAIIYIGRLMKYFYTQWNRENVEDAVIVNDMRLLSGGKLNISLEKVKAEGLFDPTAKDRTDRGRPNENNMNNMQLQNRGNQKKNKKKRK
jgi:hypothetical protein